jgi:predicted Zn-dependent protease
MKRIICFGFAMLVLFSSVLLMAVLYNHQETGVSIWLPDKWQIKPVGNALYAISPDGNAVAKYIRLDAENMKQARAIYQRSMDPQIRRIQVIKGGERFQRNNLEFEVIHAQASVRRATWNVRIYLIQTPLKMGLLVQRYRQGSSEQKIPFTNILESIKPY